MSDNISGSSGRIGPGWYVIAEPHQDPARVIAGPKDPKSAESHAEFLMDPNAKIMHTPALVNAIKNNGYNVSWQVDVKKPRSLRMDSHRSVDNKTTDSDRSGGSR